MTQVQLIVTCHTTVQLWVDGELESVTTPDSKHVWSTVSRKPYLKVVFKTCDESEEVTVQCSSDGSYSENELILGQHVISYSVEC